VLPDASSILATSTIKRNGRESGRFVGCESEESPSREFEEGVRPMGGHPDDAESEALAVATRAPSK